MEQGFPSDLFLAKDRMPVDGLSVVVVACTSRISYRQPRPVWTFDERQPGRETFRIFAVAQSLEGCISSDTDQPG